MASMKKTLAPPPGSGSYFLDRFGLLSSAWYSWFQELYSFSKSNYKSLQKIELDGTEGVDTIEFDLTNLNGFTSYKLILTNINVSVNDTIFNIQVSLDGGATYEAGATDYHWIQNTSSPTSSVIYDDSDDHIELNAAGINFASSFTNGEIILPNMNNTALSTGCYWTLYYLNASNQLIRIDGSGLYRQHDEVTGFKFYLTAGSSVQFDGFTTIELLGAN